MDNTFQCYNKMPVHFMYEDLVNMIQECEATCEHMTHHIKMMAEEMNMRVTQATLLRDCADICTITAKYVARDSFFAGYTAALCAQICIACANECMKFKDSMSQNCAQICYACARHCNEFALGRAHQ